MAVESTPGIESSEFYFNKVVEYAPTELLLLVLGAPRGWRGVEGLFSGVAPVLLFIHPLQVLS